MKSKILLLITFFLTITAQAQVKIGIRAGVNSARITSFTQFDKEGYLNGGQEFIGLYKPIIAFQAGIVADIALSDNFSFQPGIMYSVKGAKSQFTLVLLQDLNGDKVVDSYDFIAEKPQQQVTYVEIPLVFLYKKDFGAAKLFLGAGPYIGFGISGKYKDEVRFIYRKQTFNFDESIVWNKSDYDQKIKDGKAALGINRFDAGLNFTLGLEFNELFQVGINYGMGIVNILPDYIEGVTPTKNRVLSLTGTVLFGK